MKNGRNPTRYLASVPKFGVDSAKKTQSKNEYTITDKQSNLFGQIKISL